jgi:integrase
VSGLADAVADYLVVRRALGYKLARAEKLLGQFVAHCEQVGATTVRTDVAVAWAQLPAEGSAWWWSQRLGVVRAFAVWQQARDRDCEVPPAGVFGPARSGRAVPYLYTDAEVVALMDATYRLRYPLERATYRALVGLLAVSGLRIGEAIALDRADVDFDEAQLTVWRSKFGKSRVVTLHTTTVNALSAYASVRDELCPHPKAPSFFVSSAGTRLVYCNVSSLFHKLVRLAGLVPRGERCRPRLHDFRHRFAVLTLLDWHRGGRDVEARLPLLSTFMGHADPKHTYWYLSATPELLALAADRLDRHEQERRS